MSTWVATVIVKQIKLKERISYLKHFIKIAKVNY